MKALLTLTFVCLISVAGFAQFNKNNKPSKSMAAMPLKDRIFYGGGGSFAVGTYPGLGLHYTYIAVNPLIGYRINMPWGIGVQFLYQTFQFQQGAAPSLNQFGIAPFTQYRFGPLFVYGEYQLINALNVNGENRQLFTRLPIGLGYTTPIGPRSAVNIVALYDVLYGARGVYSPFLSPIVIRVYVTAGGVGWY